MEIVRLVDSRLSVRIQVAPPYFVSELAGAADDTGQAALREWTERMAEEAEPVVVVEMGALEELTGAAISTLSRGLKEAQRLDKGVRLVRCRRSDFDRLRAAGLRGEVWHCGSLAQATDGQVGGDDTTTRLHIRADTTALPRLGVLLGALARQLKLSSEMTDRLTASVLETATHAVRRGTRRGPAPRMSVLVHRHPGQLVFEVQESGVGCETEVAGAGIKQPADEVEFLPNPEGLLTRLSFWLPSRWEPT